VEFSLSELGERPLRWLHLSDIHLSKEPAPDSRFILTALLDFLRQSAKSQPIDLIFVTGDLAFSGQAEEYANVAIFFSALSDATRVPDANIFVVPGNHDVDRERVHWLCRNLSSQEQIDQYFQPNAGLPHVQEGLASFLEWHDGFFAERPPFPTDTTAQALDSTVIRGVKVNVLKLNTAAFCRGDDDHGKLVIGRSCLDDAVRQLEPEGALRIAIAHHPLDWLSEVDRPFVRTTLRSKVNLFLHGHSHDPDASGTYSVDGKLAVIGAGAAYQTENYLNSFWIAEWNGCELALFPYKYSAVPRPLWSLDTSIAPDSPGYAVRLGLEIGMPDEVIAASAGGGSISTREGNVGFAPDTLLTSPRGEPLYVEPRLGSIPFNDPTVQDLQDRTVELGELVRSNDSYIIESKAEYGATTLGMRLEYEIAKSGKLVKFLNARSLPAYGTKFSEAIAVDGKDATVILDNFDISDHRRLLKYIKESGLYTRYILITAPTGTFKRSAETQIVEVQEFKTVFHWPLSRQDVRKVTRQVFGEISEDYENALVDKVYEDLLSLKIPLSPGNVIMYLRVLLREEHFVPATRIDIVFRYVAELLRRSSDIYRDSFGSKSKIDVIAAFSYSLYCDGRSDFSAEDWTKFCRAYSDETLFEFDARGLLEECERVKLLFKYGARYYYRYSSYFPLFVGKHISARPARVQEFVKNDGPSRLDGLVEVVSALSSDNTDLVESLSTHLRSLLGNFRSEYIPRNFEPYKELTWGSGSNDEELWAGIERDLIEGPKSGAEIDKKKTDLIGEIRTDDQSVTYKTLVDLESQLFRVHSDLSIALKNSESVGGQLKIDAARLVEEVDFVALQIGFLLGETIAKNYLIHWGGIAFVNPDADENATDADVGKVLAVMPSAVLHRVGETLATRRLSAVFHRLVDELDPKEFVFVTNFGSLVSAKGTAWEAAARKAIVRVDRNSFYLRTMLGVLMYDYKMGVNSIADRESLKTLISIIHSKRQGRTNSPGNQLISKVRKIVEKKLDAPTSPE
jgi:hypothetical protein